MFREKQLNLVVKPSHLQLQFINIPYVISFNICFFLIMASGIFKAQFYVNPIFSSHLRTGCKPFSSQFHKFLILDVMILPPLFGHCIISLIFYFKSLFHVQDKNLPIPLLSKNMNLPPIEQTHSPILYLFLILASTF